MFLNSYNKNLEYIVSKLGTIIRLHVYNRKIESVLAAKSSHNILFTRYTKLSFT